MPVKLGTGGCSQSRSYLKGWPPPRLTYWSLVCTSMEQGLLRCQGSPERELLCNRLYVMWGGSLILIWNLIETRFSHRKGTPESGCSGILSPWQTESTWWGHGHLWEVDSFERYDNSWWRLLFPASIYWKLCLHDYL